MGQLILNVDDFEAQRYTRSVILRHAGFEVIEAAGGREALAIARQRHPALVLLDVHLPDVDGRDVCRELKAGADTAPPLVLHISATFREPAARSEALDNGADGYLVEPVEPEELVSHVRALLRLAAAETDARDARAALLESRERLRSFFDATCVMMAVVEVGDDDLTYLAPNTALASLFGLTPKQLSGKRGRDLGLPEDTIREWLAVGRRVEEERRPLTLEYPLQIGERTRWYHATVSPIRSSHPLRVALSILDITDRKTAEEERHELQQRVERQRSQLRAVYQALTDGVTVFDETGHIVLVNDAVARFCGYTGAEEMRQRVGHDHPGFELYELDGTSVPFSQWPVSRVQRGEAVDNWPLRVRRADGGEERIISYTGRSIPSEAGGGRLALIVSRDVTVEKQIEAALRRSLALAEARETEIEALYDAAPIGLCIFDAETRYIRVNRRLAEINGRPASAHVGRPVRQIVPDLADQAETLIHRVVATGEPVMGVEVAGEAPSQPGVRRTWLQNWYPVKGPAGEVVAVSVAAEEITGRKRMEEELRQANRLKDEFLATLSHELRTPLTAILGWSHMLERGLSPDLARKATQAIMRSAEAQRRLVSDILDMARITTGKLRLQLQQVDLLDVVTHAIESMQPAIDAKQLSLDVSGVTSDAMVTGDPERLQQVLWNLLSNAAKFTPLGGTIALGARRRSGMLDITVRDTGPGISPEFLPFVFDRFAQADGSSARKHGGLGLGLAIVRHLVELHGGSVSASSEGVGKGATFTVSLPLRAVRTSATVEPLAWQPSTPSTASAPGLAGLRVLVLDDMEDARTAEAEQGLPDAPGPVAGMIGPCTQERSGGRRGPADTQRR